ncbi:RNA-binding region RNP-1 domain-containing protein [Tieghemostelium lacteum]|uniref:RNA-binding region RNP-1 domain-containing protein n=1 Tax=Tieghemostelium lacteum TaxID=361077 RepID=A0A152A6S5_TIELA|nr:RNA-binding region RNP-1 domain-containing protein [Tieghemostelium lacteum]|eukprot:KYR01777.1 RNA-binding region RNP-1 domain-containing protein [Tieghemostelium lacteum]
MSIDISSHPPQQVNSDSSPTILSCSSNGQSSSQNSNDSEISTDLLSPIYNDIIGSNINSNISTPPTSPNINQNSQQITNSSKPSHCNNIQNPTNSIAGKIFVGGLPKSTSNEKLKKYFSDFAVVKESIIIKSNEKSVKSRGFGFVTFYDNDIIDQLLTMEHIIDQKKVEIRKAIPKEVMSDEIAVTIQPRQKLFVGGLPKHIYLDEFRNYFQRYGELLESNLLMERNGSAKGYGFITFKDNSINSIVLNDTHMIDGKKVDVRIADSKKASNNPNNPSKNNKNIYNDNDKNNQSSYIIKESESIEKPTLKKDLNEEWSNVPIANNSINDSQDLSKMERQVNTNIIEEDEIDNGQQESDGQDEEDTQIQEDIDENIQFSNHGSLSAGQSNTITSTSTFSQKLELKLNSNNSGGKKSYTLESAKPNRNSNRGNPPPTLQQHQQQQQTQHEYLEYPYEYHQVQPYYQQNGVMVVPYGSPYPVFYYQVPHQQQAPHPMSPYYQNIDQHSNIPISQHQSLLPHQLSMQSPPPHQYTPPQQYPHSNIKYYKGAIANQQPRHPNEMPIPIHYIAHPTNIQHQQHQQQQQHHQQQQQQQQQQPISYYPNPSQRGYPPFYTLANQQDTMGHYFGFQQTQPNLVQHAHGYTEQPSNQPIPRQGSLHPKYPKSSSLTSTKQQQQPHQISPQPQNKISQSQSISKPTFASVVASHHNKSITSLNTPDDKNINNNNNNRNHTPTSTDLVSNPNNNNSLQKPPTLKIKSSPPSIDSSPVSNNSPKPSPTDKNNSSN